MKKLLFILITLPLIGFAQENKVKKNNYFEDITNEERRILVHKGTEKAWSGRYISNFEKGLYVCKACNNPLFRLEGGESIANLEVYPNPSRDIFNITFTSETVQNLKVRIINLVGEEIILEDLQQFVGEYTKQINLQDNAKGIYFLEIETDEGIINKKLILQ